MTFESAQRVSELLMALAFIQQALEHLATNRRDRWLFLAQIALAVGVAAGVSPAVMDGLLLLTSIDLIRRFDGPYNGGSDRMRLLVVSCLLIARVAPTPAWQRVALGYLAVQVVLSYGLAGWVKLANPDWRRGQALTDVIAFSVYPVSEGLREWARLPGLMVVLSWSSIAFELLFPLSLLNPLALKAALAGALLFHLLNACVFGLNRFVWIWLSAYPCLIWFQQEFVLRAF